MNNSEILALVFELREMILKSDLYIDLKNKEKEMLLNEESSFLLYQFEKLKDEYSEAKRFEKYGSNVKVIQQQLSELKIKLDDNKLIKEYNNSYKKMKKKLKNIENIIFENIIEKRRELSIEK